MDIECDAIACNDQINYMAVLSSYLSSDDMKKLFFLCLDIIPEDSQCPSSLEDLHSLLSIKLNLQDFTPLWKELLFYIKKYRLLRILNTCQHQMDMKIESEMYVNQARLLLFNLCENLENEKIVVLKKILDVKNISITPGWENLAGEDFFRNWLKNIDDEKIKYLEKALSKMKYKNIKFENEMKKYFERPYEIQTPAPGKPCGLAVIFTHEFFNKESKQQSEKWVSNLEYRKGAIKDEQTFCQLWYSFGFDVIVFRNKCSDEIKEIIKKLSKIDYSTYSVFICCFMTHGSKDHVYASDNIPLCLWNEIIYMFDSSEVPSLQTKPKIFFIQACQTVTEQSKRKQENNIDSDSGNERFSNSVARKNIAVCLSTLPFDLSFRKETGTWFVQTVAEVFHKRGEEKPFIELMNIVNDEVSSKSGVYGKHNVNQTSSVFFTVFYSLRLKKFRNDNIEITKLNDLRCIHRNRPVLKDLIVFKPDMYII